MSTKTYLITFDPGNPLKGVTLCSVDREARKRTYVKIENAGEYAGIQGSPAGEGFYVNPENILKKEATFEDFNNARTQFKTLITALGDLIAATEAQHTAIEEEHKAKRQELIDDFVASLATPPADAEAA